MKPTYIIPAKRVKTVPHVVKNGSRQHVIWWDTKGTHCSCPECEVNTGRGKPIKSSRVTIVS